MAAPYYQTIIDVDHMPRSVFSVRYKQFLRMLIEARKKAGLSQSELANRIDRPQSYVSKYEHGERRLDLVEFLELAPILGIDVGDFIRELDQDS